MNCAVTINKDYKKVVVRGACVLDCPISSLNGASGDEKKVGDTDISVVTSLFTRTTRSELGVFDRANIKYEFIYTGEELTQQQIEELQQARKDMINKCGFML